MISFLSFLVVYFSIRAMHVGDKNLKMIYQLCVGFFGLAIIILLVLK
jgi:hypothetical protein